MKVGSHNSWTYRKADKWWMRLFNFITKCQRKDIATQLELGAEIFDLRLRLVENDWRVAHGITTYDTLPIKDLKLLNNKGCYCRVLLEYNKEPDDVDWLCIRFDVLCRRLVELYPNIKWFGGNCKWKWSKVAHDFGRKPPKFIDAYSSMADKNKVNDLWPFLWAKHHNAEYRKAFSDTDDTLLMDFVEI